MYFLSFETSWDRSVFERVIRSVWEIGEPGGGGGLREVGKAVCEEGGRARRAEWMVGVIVRSTIVSDGSLATQIGGGGFGQ